VVVHYLYLISIAFISPNEANSPLVINTDAVLALTIALQLLQPITRWDTQIINR
jgi:hypothetical protein